METKVKFHLLSLTLLLLLGCEQVSIQDLTDLAGSYPGKAVLIRSIKQFKNGAIKEIISDPVFLDDRIDVSSIDRENAKYNILWEGSKNFPGTYRFTDTKKEYSMEADHSWGDKFSDDSNWEFKFKFFPASDSLSAFFLKEDLEARDIYDDNGNFLHQEKARYFYQLNVKR